MKSLMIFLITAAVLAFFIGCGGEEPTSVNSLEQATTFSVGDSTLTVDEDGFIEEPERWNDEVAAALAKNEGIPRLTTDHWKVVDFIRSYYLKVGVAPSITTLCKATGFSLLKIYDLFPSGPAKGACKIAGLPNPAL